MCSPKIRTDLLIPPITSETNVTSATATKFHSPKQGAGTDGPPLKRSLKIVKVKVKVKVKLSLCFLTDLRAMKAYWGSGSRAPRRDI
jgi:hypothetical protein